MKDLVAQEDLVEAGKPPRRLWRASGHLLGVTTGMKQGLAACEDVGRIGGLGWDVLITCGHANNATGSQVGECSFRFDRAFCAQGQLENKGSCEFMTGLYSWQFRPQDISHSLMCICTLSSASYLRTLGWA